jgi:hypothetical protein
MFQRMFQRIKKIFQIKGGKKNNEGWKPSLEHITTHIEKNEPIIASQEIVDFLERSSPKEISRNLKKIKEIICNDLDVLFNINNWKKHPIAKFFDEPIKVKFKEEDLKKIILKFEVRAVNRGIVEFIKMIEQRGQKLDLSEKDIAQLLINYIEKSPHLHFDEYEIDLLKRISNPMFQRMVVLKIIEKIIMSDKVKTLNKIFEVLGLNHGKSLHEKLYLFFTKNL